ncbi:putative leucine-rich repeat receptor-like protein kinase [Iris pallida]|uniref:Leucine-rich repeat receptor-like protein kinase n=1 Tax=Iris pallida TaxID=29817 RepID=A0AAX6DG60_IRIPA|nr:putative leucine-rich repeat receptor-like protein kinase [Iris pallida]
MPIIMCSKPSPIIFAILFLALLCSGASTAAGCVEGERNALVDFKRGLLDHTGRLSSWTGSDCCNWQGVACSNRTGHVVRLDLRNPHPFSSRTDDQPYNEWSMGGELRPSLLGLKKLRHLDLSMNNFGGRPIPEFIGSIRNLRYLNLSQAGLGGLVPRQIGNLSSLQYLDLYNDLDYFSGRVPEFSIDDPLWISGLSSLQHLDMGGVKFGDTSSLVEYLNMLPHIVEVRLSYCEIQSIPLSLPHVNFTRLSTLDLSRNGINSPTIPSWLFNVSSLVHLDLSLNFFRGSIPADIQKLSSLEVLRLSSNLNLQGVIPKEVGNICKLHTLDLSYVNISRSLPELGDVFSGCIKTSLENLYLFETGLTGYLPDWLGDQLTSLKFLDLSSNNLSGGIPDTIGSLSSLEALHLSNNSLSGEIPSSLQGCTGLVILDLSQNKFTGKVPTWIGESCPSLRILRLRSNMFAGRIPQNLSRLIGLQIVDLAHNNLSGTIPKSFGRFAAMKVKKEDSEYVLQESTGVYVESMEVDMKGGALTYGDSNGILSLVTALDLSGNNLYGTIPREFGSLRGLMSLNLSGNHLNGEIPKEVGLMQSLESLDLSRNDLSGAIPSTMTYLTFLSYLNLSSNNLSGRIPSGNQLQTFSESTYTGNPGLCGFPVKQICENDDNSTGTRNNNTSEEDGDGLEAWLPYLGTVPGFPVGFWVFWGTLILKSNWKDAYIRYIDRQYDRIYVIVAITFNRFKNSYV